jgi:hypothetical protein
MIMPVLKVHFETSLRRTGKEHHDVHQFVDAPGKKDGRHDIKKIHEFVTGKTKPHCKGISATTGKFRV